MLISAGKAPLFIRFLSTILSMLLGTGVGLAQSLVLIVVVRGGSSSFGKEGAPMYVCRSNTAQELEDR